MIFDASPHGAVSLPSSTSIVLPLHTALSTIFQSYQRLTLWTGLYLVGVVFYLRRSVGFLSLCNHSVEHFTPDTGLSAFRRSFPASSLYSAISIPFPLSLLRHVLPLLLQTTPFTPRFYSLNLLRSSPLNEQLLDESIYERTTTQGHFAQLSTLTPILADILANSLS